MGLGLLLLVEAFQVDPGVGAVLLVSQLVVMEGTELVLVRDRKRGHIHLLQAAVEVLLEV